MKKKNGEHSKILILFQCNCKEEGRSSPCRDCLLRFTATIELGKKPKLVSYVFSVISENVGYVLMVNGQACYDS